MEHRTAPEKIDSKVDVHVEESIGTIFLGILALVLLIAFLRSQQQLRETLQQSRREIA